MTQHRWNKSAHAPVVCGAQRHVCMVPKPDRIINSEGFLAEVFHPWVRWEGPGSGFQSSSGGGAGGVWKSRNLPPWD